MCNFLCRQKSVLLYYKVVLVKQFFSGFILVFSIKFARNTSFFMRHANPFAVIGGAAKLLQVLPRLLNT